MQTSELAGILGPHYAEESDSSVVYTDLQSDGGSSIDSARYGIGGVKKFTSLDDVDALLSAMEAAGELKPTVKAAYLQFTSIGLDFSDSDVQATIDAMAAGAFGPSATIPADLAAKVKSIGVKQRTKWESIGGYGDIPTLSEISDALNLYQLREWFEGKSQDVIAKINNGTITDQAGVAAVMEA